MAQNLRRAVPTIHRSLSAPSSLPRSSPFSPLSSRAAQPSPVSKIQRFQFQARSFRSSSISLAKNWDLTHNHNEEIGPDTILFEGCDYNHWRIVVDFPKGSNIPLEEMIKTYEEICAKGLNVSVEEAKKKIYACSTKGFQVLMSEEESEKFNDVPGVIFVLPDSYIDPENKEYGGDKYDNGKIILRPPPFPYENRGSRYCDHNRYDRPNQQVPLFLGNNGQLVQRNVLQGEQSTYTPPSQGSSPVSSGQGSSPASYGQGSSNGTYGQGSSTGTYGQGQRTRSYEQGPRPPSTGAYGQGQRTRSYDQGSRPPTTGSYGQGLISGSYDQGPSTGSYGQGSSTKSYGQGPSTGSYGKRPSTGSYGQGPSAGSYGQGPSTGSYGQGPSAGSYRQGPITGSYGQSPSAGGPSVGPYVQSPSAGSYGQGSYRQGPITGSYGQGPSSGSCGQGPSSGYPAPGDQNSTQREPRSMQGEQTNYAPIGQNGTDRGRY